MNGFKHFACFQVLVQLRIPTVLGVIKMRYRVVSFVAASVLISVGLFAAPPIGTFSSSGPVEINGNRVETRALSSLPLAEGDTLTTTTMSAVIAIRDITNIVLDSNTKVRLTREGKDINVELLAGAITYKLGSTVTEKVFASDKPVLMQLRLGSKKGPFLLTGAGAGTAAGVAATRPSDEKPKPKSVSQ